jgi:hypothetical protein
MKQAGFVQSSTVGSMGWATRSTMCALLLWMRLTMLYPGTAWFTTGASAAQSAAAEWAGRQVVILDLPFTIGGGHISHVGARPS